MNTTSGQVHRSSKAGFTLAEVIVAMTVFGLAMSAILSSLLFANRACYDLEIQTDLNRRTRYAMEQLGMDLRSTVEIRKATYFDLQVVTEDAGGKQQTVSYQFVPSAKELIRTDSSGNKRYLLLNLDYFYFFFYDSDDYWTSNIIDMKKISVYVKQVQHIGGSPRDIEYKSARFLMRNRLAATPTPST